MISEGEIDDEEEEETVMVEEETVTEALTDCTYWQSADTIGAK